ncbi:N-acetyltransferase [Apilactobacillus apisilvae]|uniref:N-acetyltransferase n=1 Tax=Apilactobacillus apisilvae TaxID=2923364 RepID=A0ABY4PIL3_9LACO|nr:N-acetyltransferase [Apilactobacillus apisilvae]UQS85427.1 N-acetyltransferase [Apilactobacillus apisilvae]
MLLKYRSEYEKIVMDMLSFLPNMTNEHLKNELEWYKASDQRIIYLWKNENNNWAGMLCVECNKDLLVVRRIILTPDSWSMNNCCIMLNQLTDLHINKRIVGTMDTTEICEIWEKRNATKK